MFDTHVTVVGNLVAEPRLAFTKDGQAVTSFRLAATPRRFDRVAGEWRDGETLFTNVTCWRALAENVAASLKKGSAAIVIGRLSVRPYETRDGAQRQSVEIDALAVGSELGRAITIVKRAERGVVASGAADLATDDAATDDAAADDAVHEAVGDDEVAGAFALDGALDPMAAPDEWSGEAALSSADVPGFDMGSTDDPAGGEDENAVTAPAQLASSGGRWRSRGSVG
ncbi:MAG: single-strand DNA-binding protein [Actinomycetota bacterium]|nr:single-strand DNA-binding protein [Actinomycetota bacterium]